MAQSRKKVIVRPVAGDPFAGYLPSCAFVRTSVDPENSGNTHDVLDLLDLAGRAMPVALSEIKWVSFVRDFNVGDLDNPERVTRRTFLARPRSEGLWVRITFTGGDQLEGLAALDISVLDGLVDDAGLFLTPPDERSNTHLIFIPRLAITGFQVLGVITTPSRLKGTRGNRADTQPGLFPLDP